ncbi:alpha/beta hydrolase [Amycolatopsis rubida]|uniref:Alpha/beta hydrolase n=1 Tax=Amycolatopsis rubida TaxID=112413 RepID=A0ABX0C2B5_9PSEU|nr:MULTISPECIES: alpha/beta hydrolase [Amycolatopsis]MYW95945.1 alpha/beta fold hydrolase [Amycolatopsis rubida]NEC60935.1 alpha/beta hydrolase [Amycolatopsis rubida]OAP25159.1 3-oxoadipate enol-lactonase 2 [Amycolatopsis sp. M39]
MPRAQANGLELEYDTFGDPAAPPIVLVMGLGAQMITWEEGFCELLASRGFHVVRFDNRDAGLSTWFDELGAPDLAGIVAGTAPAPYLLSDLADDIVGLFDALGFAKAHVVGASMGGMVAQQLAIDHPDRLLSLTSIMSTTGDQSVGQVSPAALATLTKPAPETREEQIEQSVANYRVTGSPGYPATEECLRRRATRSYDRARHPVGMQRQAAAVVASGDRTERLHDVRVPAVVLHGDSDVMIDVSGGKATAAAIPDAELVIVAGMGHDLPEPLWPEIVAAIVRAAARA